MKSYIILLLMLLIVPISLASYICQDEMIAAEIPCQGITPIMANCSDGLGNWTYNITDINNSFAQLEFGNLSYISLGLYNFSFNYNVTGNSYHIALCDNSTAIISIGIDSLTDDNTFWFYVLMFTIFIILYIIGMKMEEKVILILDGFFITVFGVYTEVYGLLNLNNELLQTTLFLVEVGLGAYLIIRYTWEMIN